MTKYIAFDGTHKCRGNIDENYSQLKDLLNSNDFECHNFIDMMAQSTLKPFDILVFACPDFAKLTPQEINEIEAWVKNDGGGLLLLSHAGGDRGRSSNLNELAENFGMAFENDQVLDERSNLGLENLPIIYSPNFNPPHTITDGLDSICFRAGCSLTIVGGGAIAIAISNETSDPFSTPLICISEVKKGRVCAMGSYEMFRNKVGGGLAYAEHSTLALNIFNWLVSEQREEIRKKQKIKAPTPQVQSAFSQPQSTMRSMPTSKSVDIDSVNIDYDIKISNRSELMALLKLFADQISTMKKTIDVLIEKVAVEDDSAFGMDYQYPDQYQQQYADQQYADQQYADQQYAGYPQESYEPRDPKDMDFIDYSYEAQGKHVLSSLPKKPESLVNKETIPKRKGTKSKSSKVKTDALVTEDFDNEKLLEEKESLANKVKSVRELMTFINKKHDAGKLDDKSFEKQIRKLEKDLRQAQSRIDEIDKIFKR